ncbi:hypothetical protein DFQ13_102766 [Actinokineospora spheciospongiae]|nr:hypothetical protein DFQ13_102766 [Actinokineospora spheciospongiae]
MGGSGVGRGQSRLGLGLLRPSGRLFKLGAPRGLSCEARSFAVVPGWVGVLGFRAPVVCCDARLGGCARLSSAGGLWVCPAGWMCLAGAPMAIMCSSASGGAEKMPHRPGRLSHDRHPRPNTSTHPGSRAAGPAVLGVASLRSGPPPTRAVAWSGRRLRGWSVGQAHPPTRAFARRAGGFGGGRLAEQHIHPTALFRSRAGGLWGGWLAEHIHPPGYFRGWAGGLRGGWLAEHIHPPGRFRSRAGGSWGLAGFEARP